MKNINLQLSLLLVGILLPSAWLKVDASKVNDGYHPIQVKEAHVQSVPKGSSIQASINGHLLTVVFLENLGQVTVEITTATDSPVDFITMSTPNT